MYMPDTHTCSTCTHPCAGITPSICQSFSKLSVAGEQMLISISDWDDYITLCFMWLINQELISQDDNYYETEVLIIIG